MLLLVSYPWLSQGRKVEIMVKSPMFISDEANLRIKPLSSTWNVRPPAGTSGDQRGWEGSELTGHKSMIMAMGINMCITYLIWLIIWLYDSTFHNQQYAEIEEHQVGEIFWWFIWFQIHVQSVLSNKKGQKNQKMSMGH